MFINKVGSLSNFQPKFKGYDHAKNSTGEEVLRFYYPANDARVTFYKVKKNDKAPSGYEVLGNQKITEIQLSADGTVINPKDIPGLSEGEAFAYNITIDGNRTVADTGIQVNGFTLVTQNGTKPTVQGTGYYAFTDSFFPGIKYNGFDEENTGKITNENSLKTTQKAAESTTRTFSNKMGGSLAGIEYKLKDLKEMGVKTLFTPPTMGGDNVSSHYYWTSENKQIPVALGTSENYNSFIRELYKNGITHVFDGTYTSEGLQGVHFQYALRWANSGTTPQPYHWFKMTGLKDSSIGLGIVPENYENLRHRVINPQYVYDEAANKIVENPNYDSTKETYVQAYDASQVADGQLARLDAPIETYEKIRSGNFLDINSHDDTLINYVFQVDPKEHKAQLQKLVEANKGVQTPIKESSPEGTLLICQFSTFKFTGKTEGGAVTWDANTDMIKKNYGISGYDIKLDKAIGDLSQRDYEQYLRQRGAYEVQDMAIQDGKFVAQKYKDVQILYTAQALQGAKTIEEIQALIDAGELPEEALIDSETITNVLNNWHTTSNKTDLSKEDLTIKSLMQFPLTSLEVANNTLGVLATSFFSNLATEEDLVGIERFELMQQDNPHLAEPYKKNYNKVNKLFTGEIKDFADEVINKLNELSEEKLLDENGEYTDYGISVIQLLGQDIAKYALLKAVRGEELKTKTLANGEITFDYDDIRANTSLQNLGIIAGSMETEASRLTRHIEKGLNKLSQEDIDYVAGSLAQRLEGTNASSFALARAMVDKAGLGISIRLDAAKDIIDMDAVRNGEMDFDQAWDAVINFWKKYVQAIKQINPNANIVAEITDVEQLMKDILGYSSIPYDSKRGILEKLDGRKYLTVDDAMLRFFVETGITTEAAYSYFFTNLLKVFSPEFESGSSILNQRGRTDSLNDQFIRLVNSRSADYLRNLYTFAGNHDKPRVLHGLALDMGLFHANLADFGDPGESRSIDNNMFNRSMDNKTKKTRDYRRETLKILTNSDDMGKMPLEAILNLDNPEYFLGPISTKAVAMSKLIRDSINNSLNTIDLSKHEIDALKQATTDLANANIAGTGKNMDFQTIKIPELSSIENATNALLDLAVSHGAQISEGKRKEIVSQIKNYVTKADQNGICEKLDFYSVRGDFNWKGNYQWCADIAKERVNIILGYNNPNESKQGIDYMLYSLYTVNVASLIGDALSNVIINNEPVLRDSNLADAFKKAQQDFIKKYNRATVEASRTKLPLSESYHDAMMKNGYGATDINKAIEEVIEQAEYILRKQGKLNPNEHIANYNEILLNLFKHATEPAVTKSCMYYAFLSAIMGDPTIYGGDELGMSGYDEKAKNVYLQNRNTLWWNKLEEGPLKEYIKSVYDRMDSALAIRRRDGVQALSNGTPYVQPKSGKQNDNSHLQQITEGSYVGSYLPSLFMHNADGNSVVSVFNTTGIDPLNTSNPNQPEVRLDYILLPAAIALAEGTIFRNSNPADKARYVLTYKDINGNVFTDGRPRVCNEAGKVAINSTTAPNGVLVLADETHISKDATKKAQAAIRKTEAEARVAAQAAKAKKHAAPKAPAVKPTVTNPVKSTGNKKAWAIAAASIAVVAAGYAVAKKIKNNKSEKNQDLNIVV